MIGSTTGIISGYYGDSTKWRSIANANGISDPLAIAPGTILAIPDRSDTR